MVPTDLAGLMHQVRRRDQLDPCRQDTVYPMNMLALTFGSSTTASTKYRLVQYQDHLHAAGIYFDMVPAREFRNFAGLADYDVVLLQKTLLPGPTLRKIRRSAKRLLYDADDLIWLSPGKRHSILTRFRSERRLRTIARIADLCLAANGVIAAELESRGGRATVVPMALDGRTWQEPQKEESPLVIGWSGAPHNLMFIREILPQLREVQRRFPTVKWLFHSGEDPRFVDFVYTHIPFVPGREQEAVSRFHVGLLPLPNDPFVRGKSPIKSLQYFASRVAVAGSPVGATREILHDGENSLWVREPRQWAEVLERLLADASLRQRLAAAGRKAFEDTYELQKVSEKFIAVLRGTRSDDNRAMREGSS